MNLKCVLCGKVKSYTKREREEISPLFSASFLPPPQNRSRRAREEDEGNLCDVVDHKQKKGPKTKKQKQKNLFFRSLFSRLSLCGKIIAVVLFIYAYFFILDDDDDDDDDNCEPVVYSSVSGTEQ